MKFKLPVNKETLTIAFHKPYDTSTLEGRALERQRRIALTALTSTILRVLTMAVPLIALKITYSYLNVEVYGLWSAITTFFALFAFSDLGLGNGLQTKLSQANGSDDINLCRKIISNTYAILILVAIVLLIVFLAIFWLVDWAKVMNAQSEETIALASTIVFIIVIPKLMAIPIAIIQRTQLALQEGYRSDIWSIIGYIFNLIFIVVIAKMDYGKITLLTVTSVLPVLVSAVNMFVYFRYQRKELRFSIRLFDSKMAKSLLSLGVFFSFLSILTTIGLSMDTFIVAKTCTLADAGSYSILYRVSAIFSAVVGILSAPLWGANGEAIARGDIEWVKKNTRRMSIIMGSISVFIALIGIASAKYIFRIWMGADFEFSFASLIWLAVMQITLSFISPYFMLLNASGVVRKQIILFGIYTPISFVLKYYLSAHFGIFMIPMIGSLLYLFIVALGTYRLSLSQLKQLSINPL